MQLSPKLSFGFIHWNAKSRKHTRIELFSMTVKTPSPSPFPLVLQITIRPLKTMLRISALDTLIEE